MRAARLQAHWKVFSRLLLLSCVALLAITLQMRSAAADDALKKGAEKFVAAIESKDMSDLLRLFSRQGTSFISGTAALPKAEYSFAEIREDFERKTGAYCVFFDSSCLIQADEKERARSNHPPGKVRLKSASDLLALSKEKRFVTYPESATNGKVTLLLSSRTVDTATLGEDALNFYFRQEGGEWKLRNMEFQ